MQPGCGAVADDVVGGYDLRDRGHPELDRVLAEGGREDAAHDLADLARASTTTEVGVRAAQASEIGSGERFIGPRIHVSTVSDTATTGWSPPVQLWIPRSDDALCTMRG
ncbi:hypothetical protein GCM10023349_44250 [Nocardioides conyzicola]|uniref:Uncharacterized protein n=1 Tax=Nocardioides conyzicola TaxID=1651781 RepID=A0ABP8Y1K9_9ACTN